MESGNVLTKQQRIAKNARIHRDVPFTSLAYHMDLEWLPKTDESVDRANLGGPPRKRSLITAL